MDAKQLGNILASTLGDLPAGEEVPEGHLYAACMGHADLDTFQAAVGLLVAAGLVVRRPGPCLMATDRLREVLGRLAGVK